MFRYFVSIKWKNQYAGYIINYMNNFNFLNGKKNYKVLNTINYFKVFQIINFFKDVGLFFYTL